MEYTSLFLDLDNTLLDFYKAEEMAIKSVLCMYSLPCDDKTVKLYSDINRSYWEQFERGEIPKEAIFEGRFKTLLSVLGVERDYSAIAKNYGIKLSEGYYKMDGADDILTYLKGKGYKLYATTNGFKFTQDNRIKHSGLDVYFDKIFISEEAGYQKPDKEYFDYCIDNIEEKDRSKILIVGDSQSSDILGGINAGIDTCWFNVDFKTAKYKSRFEISDLYELKNIL